MFANLKFSRPLKSSFVNYTWLLFDADNTLFDFSAAEAASLRDCIEQTDIGWSEEVLGIYREINHEAWVAYENGQLDKSQIRHIRFERLLDRFRCAHDVIALSDRYRMGLAASRHLLDGALEMLQTVAPHYKLGLITNGLTEVQYPRLKATGIERFFPDVVVISDEIGVAKPHQAFFDHAFGLMGRPDPENVLVIGDNPVADIGGALNYGCHACWLKTPGVMKKPPSKPQYEINNISEVLEILGIQGQ
ncbi:noncanonical pyrimidine nucleotidase, YjjG family [Lewinellaceae bacterium SD302]|nr:noncanonical pyrimidine nucleotidase, YjjG family [Lewinellaceae bacterium SD302]